MSPTIHHQRELAWLSIVEAQASRLGLTVAVQKIAQMRARALVWWANGPRYL